MKNKELYVLRSGLRNCGTLAGIRFAYAVSKNLKLLESEIKTIEETAKASKAYAEYEDKRIAVNEKYCEKNGSGDLKMMGDNYIIEPKSQKKFDEEIRALRKAYAKPIKERAKQKEDFAKFLEEESEFKPYMVKMEHVPETITAGQLSAIGAIIDDSGFDPDKKK